jgi:hypothetical protein
MNRIFSASGVSADEVRYVSNPCLGDRSSVSLITRSHAWLEEVLAGMGKKLSFIAVENKFAETVESEVDCPVFPISIYVKKLYQR